MKMEKNTAKKRIRLYDIFAVVVSVLLLLAAGNETYVSVKYKAVFMVLIFAVSAVSFLIAFFVPPLNENVNLRYISIGILLLGLALRVFYYEICGVVETSDFYQPTKFFEYITDNGSYTEYTIQYQQLDEFQRYYALFPAWGIYMMFTHLIYSLFGCQVIYMIGVNLFLFAISFLLLNRLLVQNECENSTKILILMLFACLPHMVMWSAVTTPDHFIIIFLIGLALIWIRKNGAEKKGIYIVCEAVMVALIGLFKPMTLLLILAIVFSDILVAVMDRSMVRNCIIHVIVSILCIACISSVVRTISNRCLEAYIKTDVVQAGSFYLLWGYGINANGEWSDHAMDEVFEQAYDNVETLYDVVEYTNVAAKEMLMDNWKSFPKIWRRKFHMLFYSDTWPAIWTLTNDSNQLAVELKNNYLFTNVLSAINVIMMLFMIPAFRRKDKMTVFLFMTWAGFICYLVASGIQTRYRFLILPFQLILFGLGIREMRKTGFAFKERLMNKR